jgi:3-methylfumaryl-CoA hydratase
MGETEVDYTAWNGRSRQREARLGAGDIDRLAAVLDRASSPATVPPAWHWATLLDAAPQSAIGPDGHPARGDFLPPIPLPARMFAGADMTFEAPLALDAPTELTETITAIEEKSGRGGPLVFVNLARELSQGGVSCVREVQTLVYRGAASPAPAAPVPSEAKAQWRELKTPDPVLLFRFSAATFNSHRIHYDRDYAQGVEGYPGLVAHGPLIALLLLEALHRRTEGAPLSAFRFRALRPLFDTAPFSVCGRLDGKIADLWAEAPDGGVAMTASATFP